jgi:hypothetical protein
MFHMSGSRGGTALGALAATLLLAAPAGARVVSAPGFVSGPRITGAGLLWRGSATHMLTSYSGRTRPLPGGGAAVLSSETSDWIVVVGRKQVEAGPLGGRLRPVKVLRRCTPVAAAPGARATTSADPLLALSGATLYAVVDPGCLHRQGYGRRALLAASLPTGAWRLLAAISTGVAGLAASGQRVAITYVPDAQTARSPTVFVLDASRGRRLYRMSLPSRWSPRETLTTQVDEHGDVVVTSSFFRPPAPQSLGWWATPADPVAHRLGSLVTVGQPIPEVDRSEEAPTGAATLSAGRIAYVTGGPSEREERIDLLDLRRDTSRPVAEFPGVVGADGLDMSGNELAWAQQSTPPEGGRESLAGGGIFPCQVVALGSVELTSVNLSNIGGSPPHIGPPLPAADQPPCTDFEK